MYIASFHRMDADPRADPISLDARFFPFEEVIYPLTSLLLCKSWSGSLSLRWS